MTPKIAEFLRTHRGQTPFLVFDLDVIDRNYRRLRELMPLAEVFYAVKANPASEILDRLVALGSSFDAASIWEVEQCLAAGAAPARVSFGNTIKKQADIARARTAGIDLYAFDSSAELAKLAAAAAGSRVYCRIAVDDAGADWPLSRKFGCSLRMARDLMLEASERGMVPHGVSFHVGSQQCDVRQWEVAIGKTAMLFSDLAERGLELKLVNLGGGFPVPYRKTVPSLEDVSGAIHAAVTRHFGNRLPTMIVEPGRALTADAGIIQSEVVLVARKDYDSDERWVYLDIGKFGGLAETAGEAIQYRFRTRHDGGETGPVVIAGPTCDGADVLYDAAGYRLPRALGVGDRVEILSTGAYTTTYASVGFNGFGPLEAYYI